MHEEGIDTALPERLAAAADQVVITPVPAAAVLRAARRRRTGRRLALGATTLATGGLLAVGLGALPESGGMREPTAIVVPPGSSSPGQAGVTRPSNAVLGEGSAGGYDFRVEVDVWAAAADQDEVWDQVRAMYESDTELPFEVENGANYPPVKGEDELPYRPGKSWYFLYLSENGNPRGPAGQGEVLTGRDDEIHVDGTNLDGNGNESKDAEARTVELLYGYLPEGVDRAEITWENGTVSELELVKAAGSTGHWFTAAGPEGGVDPDELRTYDRYGQPAEGYDFKGW
ncbi:hypothetical protein OG946_32445 [Streptomyces sp. NBC_01808]|uniref:hypothetical protein n=1 Tax=Streptomyces sp. NBC_01808 TaxID=2975947 RepID=UPI002DDB0859|nr:hypothetical protein [Streptomyces sp. NBC_01808]WSA41668.1 hypothetical protein OG946_32445 [Streptomyces sp. NBC_01808]